MTVKRDPRPGALGISTMLLGIPLTVFFGWQFLVTFIVLGLIVTILASAAREVRK